MLHDASGQRVAQLSVGDVDAPTPVAATVYFGATEATDADTATAGVVSATRFYGIGGATVATATAVTGGSAQWALLFGDVQGSASVSMELVANTAVNSGFEPASVAHEVVRDAYMPYGAALGLWFEPSRLSGPLLRVEPRLSRPSHCHLQTCATGIR